VSAAPQHHEIEELLGAYALDALESDEALMVEGHLDTCPRCRSELDGHREMAAALGNGIEPLPPALWDRVVEHLDEQSLPVFLEPHRSAPAGPGRRGQRPRHLGRWATALGAAAAAVVIALLGLQAAQTSQAPGLSPAQAALSTPGHRLVQLTSTSGHRLAEAVVLPDGQGLMVSNSLAQLPASETYQLWAMIGGRPISLGLLGRHPKNASFTVSTSAPPAALAVTVEPAGGVSAPDGTPLASGAVPA
jgi:anti-sigma-K factor RskA